MCRESLALRSDEGNETGPDRPRYPPRHSRWFLLHRRDPKTEAVFCGEGVWGNRFEYEPTGEFILDAGPTPSSQDGKDGTTAGPLKTQLNRILLRLVEAAVKAGAWRRANDLRAYIAAVEERASDSGQAAGASPELAERRSWVREPADLLDPVPDTLNRLLGDPQS